MSEKLDWAEWLVRLKAQKLDENAYREALIDKLTEKKDNESE